MKRFILKVAEVAANIAGSVLENIDAMRAQRHLNMAALNPFIHERIAHYEKARRSLRNAGIPEPFINLIIDLHKNEAA